MQNVQEIEKRLWKSILVAARPIRYNRATRKERSRAIAILGSGETIAYPCGVCRQVMAEFCGPDFILLCGNRDESRVEMLPFEAVLPRSFGPKDLEA